MRMNNAEMNETMLEQVNGGSCFPMYDIVSEFLESEEGKKSKEEAEEFLKNLLTKMWDKTTDTVSDTWDEVRSSVESTVVYLESILGF